MPFVKIVKNRAYFKRYQTKFRRRREGKTDYYARRNMIKQDLNKYVAPKYRLVARITNSKVIAQVVYAELVGDKVMCQADSNEFQKWGLTTGLTSYAAAYATGLLLGRRLLKQLGMDEMYVGKTEIDGEKFEAGAEAKDKRRPFMVILDVGIRRPTVGNRVFAVMKGASDAGLYVPHSNKKFPGFEKIDKKKSTYTAAVHRDRIFGCHIDEYMEKFKETETNKQFKKWKKVLKEAGMDSVEDMFTSIHEKIRAQPVRAQKTKKIKKKVKYEDKRRTIIVTESGKKYRRDRKKTYAERKADLAKKINIIRDMIANQ